MSASCTIYGLSPFGRSGADLALVSGMPYVGTRERTSLPDAAGCNPHLLPDTARSCRMLFFLPTHAMLWLSRAPAMVMPHLQDNFTMSCVEKGKRTETTNREKVVHTVY